MGLWPKTHPGSSRAPATGPAQGNTNTQQDYDRLGTRNLEIKDLIGAARFLDARFVGEILERLEASLTAAVVLRGDAGAERVTDRSMIWKMALRRAVQTLQGHPGEPRDAS